MNYLFPMVSIIIPVFNGENYLRDAIDSCLSQKYENIEIIVVNDGSSDNTESVCMEYGQKIKYFAKKNGGVSSALNLGIDKSSGDYISWLSHDDYYLPNKILDEVEVLRRTRWDSIVFSNYRVVNKNKKRISTVNFGKIFSNLNNYPQYLAIYTCCLNGCAMLIPKSIFAKYGKFDEKLKYTQDYMKWGEIIKSEFQYNESYVLCSRRHNEQDTETHAITDSEHDELWFQLIASLFKSNNYDKFLGCQESLYYFSITFSHNTKMVKTNNFINEKSDFLDLKKIKKRIRQQIPSFGSKKSNLIKVWNYYRIFGVKKLLVKLLSY